MPITAPPTIPLITDPSTFASRAQDWVVWQAEQLYPALIDESTLLGLSTTSISSTSNTIGTGAKSFAVETGKGFVAGQSLSIAYTTAPTNRMLALVTSYNSGTGALVVDVQAIEGSGTYAAWSIALAFNAVITTSQIQDLAVTEGKLAADSVTFAKLQNIATLRLLGRTTALDGNVEELAVGANLTLSAGVLSADAYPLTSDTVKASTSGSSVDFTAIPSWVTRITLMYEGVSFSSTDATLDVQLGDAGGLETAGYISAQQSMFDTRTDMGVVISTAYIRLTSSGASTNAANTFSGKLVLDLLDPSTNTWTFHGAITANTSSTTARQFVVFGSKSLSATLDRLSAIASGTGTFDGGKFNILYE